MPDDGSPRIGLALGGGAARGLRHVPYLETLEEMGIRPAVVAGTSMGALIGVCWVAGMPAAAVRDHAIERLSSVPAMAGELWRSHRPTVRDILERKLRTQVDAEAVVRSFLPEVFPDRFEDLSMPFRTVAADLDTWQETVFDRGPLLPAVAASIAIPGIFRPVHHGGHVFIDGGVTSPVPLGAASDDVDFTIALDVGPGPVEGPRGKSPGIVDASLTALEIMTRHLVIRALEGHRQVLYVHADTQAFGPMEFWRVREILEQDAAEEKERFRRRLEEHLGAWRRG